MKFKNSLEEQVFKIATEIFGRFAKVDHNKTIEIENAIFPEVSSFTGPPKKEIDIISIEISANIGILISCKLLSSPAVPSHVQEWCSVVQTMNKYSKTFCYLGFVLSPSGFTAGCEAWASAYNIGIIPPIKGKRLVFNEETFYKMVFRTLTAIKKRVHIYYEDLIDAPNFYNFVFNIVSDFEGHPHIQDSRFVIMPDNWKSSFQEMYSYTHGKTIHDIYTSKNCGVIKFDNNEIRVNSHNIEMWNDPGEAIKVVTPLFCIKNINGEISSLDEIKRIVRGLHITSAADFGQYLEFGIDGRFNLGIHPSGFHIYSTEMPINDHIL